MYYFKTKDDAQKINKNSWVGFFSSIYLKRSVSFFFFHCLIPDSTQYVRLWHFPFGIKNVVNICLRFVYSQFKPTVFKCFIKLFLKKWVLTFQFCIIYVWKKFDLLYLLNILYLKAFSLESFVILVYEGH